MISACLCSPKVGAESWDLLAFPSRGQHSTCNSEEGRSMVFLGRPKSPQLMRCSPSADCHDEDCSPPLSKGRFLHCTWHYFKFALCVHTMAGAPQRMWKFRVQTLARKSSCSLSPSPPAVRQRSAVTGVGSGQACPEWFQRLSK